jgi:hypothetical protein
MSALTQGAPQVLGKPFDGGEWLRDDSIQFLNGVRPWPTLDTNRWSLFRNPLPPSAEHRVFQDIRGDAGLSSREVGPRYDALSRDTRSEFQNEFQTLAERHNPIVRRVIRRTRPMLEERGLLKRIGVITHPRADDGLAASLFDGEGLAMNFAFKTGASACLPLAALRNRSAKSLRSAPGGAGRSSSRYLCANLAS